MAVLLFSGETSETTKLTYGFNKPRLERSISPAYYFTIAPRYKVTAVAAAGHKFDGWKGDVTDSRGNVSFVVDSSKTITAEFSTLSSLAWVWAVGGIALLLVVLLNIRFMSRRPKKPDNTLPM